MRAGVLIPILLGAAACAPPPQRHYYTLTGNFPATRFEKPFPVKLLIRDLEVRRSYHREELVIRTDAHELTYSKARRWSEPLPRMLGNLVREQVRRSGLTADIQDDDATATPDYVFGGEVEAVEQLDAGRDRYAHLIVTFKIWRPNDDAELWSFHADGKRPVSGNSARSTVRVMSELFADQVDQALVDLGRFLTDPSAPRPPASEPTATPAAEVATEPDRIGPDIRTRDVPQLQHDDTPIPVGMGAIFVPTLSDGEREPRIVVYQRDHEVAEGQHGQRIAVAPGEYDVHLGSGAVDQQISIPVRVVEAKTTVLPEKWAALEVAVVNETFIPIRGTYELINMSSRDTMGLGFGADETLGEVTRVWVLQPGLYKLIRAGGTYRDRTNFATVRLEAGKLTRFTLVQEELDGSFKGAGENDPVVGDVIASSEEDARRPWELRALLGGSLNFNNSNEVGAPKGWQLSFAVFFDGQARYAVGPHVWLTRLELEESQTRVLSQDYFQSNSDRVYLNSVYTYQLLPWFGPYARVGAETKLLPRSQILATPRDVVVVDSNGAPVRTLTQATRIELGALWAPTQLKEGAGANFRVLRRSFAELDLRFGFGARQTIANDLFVYQDQTDGTGLLIPVDDSSLFGLETTLVGIGRISTFMSITTEFDGLAPVAGGSGLVFTWRNQVTLRLLSFLSLNYRFNATRDPSLGIGSEVMTEHDVQFRFSWVIF